MLSALAITSSVPWLSARSCPDNLASPASGPSDLQMDTSGLGQGDQRQTTRTEACPRDPVATPLTLPVDHGQPHLTCYHVSCPSLSLSLTIVF